MSQTRSSMTTQTTATEATEPQPSSSPALVPAGALAQELYRRNVRLEELLQDPTTLDSTRMQVHGEVIGLQGALGIVLGGTVPGGSADRLGQEYYMAWLARAGRGQS